ncbi:hypothetical protein DL771_001848 [Monosporascus sp. 5C6A]|nr:hypothetical protein DL771_001848 [Monosporascus sp. 5C6A]
MTAIHGDIQKLSNEATGALVSLGEWLKQASFKPVDGIAMCEETDRLKEEANEFLRLFARQAKRSPTVETRITAAHFRDPYKIPVPKGSSIDVIPVRHVDNTNPSILGQDVKLGSYIHLEQDTKIEPEFYAILLLSKAQ